MSNPQSLKPLIVITEEELKTMAGLGYDRFSIKTTGSGDSAKNIILFLNPAKDRISIKEQHAYSGGVQKKEFAIVELPKEYLPIPEWIPVENATNPTYMR
ncbi:MAG: hypothetical protein WC599_14320 [Bacteroidales bacterium]